MNKMKIQKDSILTAKEQSEIVDTIFRCGEKEKTTARSLKTGEQVEAFYYKATNGERRSHKRKMLQGSCYTLRDEFELDFARWVTNGWELEQLENSLYYLPGNDEKGEKLEATRDALWGKIEPVLSNAGLIDREPAIPGKQLPKELDLDQFRELLKKAIDAGFCVQNGDGYKWSGTNPQLALFAEIAAEKLELKNKWKPFELLFGKKNLAQERYNSKEKIGTVRDGERIEALFNDLI
jgi:hypothetical protein